MDLKAHLKTLIELHGASGHEGEVRAYLQEAWAGLVDSFQVDGLGSLIGLKQGSGAEPRQRIMLSAHMDEIALMVSEVREGYLRLVHMNGMDARTLQGKSVMVHGRRRLVGTVAAVPPHIANTTGAGRKTYPSLADQWIDLGLPAEEVAALVQVGDIVTMDAPLLELKGGHLAGKAMDDRASITAVTHCLHLLQGREHRWDVCAVASVQEEKGLYGAATAANHVDPHLAIAIDVGFARQPGVSESANVDMGKGPTLSIGANFHPGLVKEMRQVANSLEMNLTEEPLPADSGTDAWAIQVARQGVPTLLFSIPIRNMHSTVETLLLKDVERTGRLMAEFIAALGDDFLEKLTWQRHSKNNGSQSEDAALDEKEANNDDTENAD